MAKLLLYKVSDVHWSFAYERGLPYINQLTDTIVDLMDRESLKKSRNIKMLELYFRNVTGDKLLSRGYLYISERDSVIRRKLFKSLPEVLLSVDFSKNKKYIYQSQPKYLDFQKALQLLQSESEQRSVYIQKRMEREG